MDVRPHQIYPSRFYPNHRTRSLFPKNPATLGRESCQSREIRVSVLSRHGPAHCPDPLGKRIALPGSARLLKSRACIAQMILWPLLCLVYTCTCAATRRPQGCNAICDPGDVVTAPVTAPPSINRGAGSLLPPPLHLPPCLLSHVRTMTSSRARTQASPERHFAGKEGGECAEPPYQQPTPLLVKPSGRFFPPSAVDARMPHRTMDDLGTPS